MRGNPLFMQKGAPRTAIMQLCDQVAKSLPENPFLQKVVFRDLSPKTPKWFQLTDATVLTFTFDIPPAI